MLKFCFLYLCLFVSVSFGASLDVIDIENHPQEVFPSVSVTINNQSVDYYGMHSDRDQKIKYVKESETLKGEIPLSGYIFAKEFVESFRIPNTLANKKTKSEFVKIFAEQDAGKMVEFILSVNEKKRTAENDKELEFLEKLIKKQRTEDDAGTTPYFSTGYIELKSPKNNNERYFIKMSDLKKDSVKLNAKKTHLNLLKSVSVYSFQNILSGLNFGDIEKGSKEERLFNDLEKINNSICSIDCPLDFTKNLSEIALDIGKIVSFEVVGNSKIEDMDDFNKYVLAQQWCVLNSFSQGCHVESLDSEIKRLSNHKVISDLIKKHKGPAGLCTFLKK